MYPLIGNSSPDAVIRHMCCGNCLAVEFVIFDARCNWISDTSTDDPESNITSTAKSLVCAPCITVAFGLIAATVTIHALLGLLNCGDAYCPLQVSPCRFPDIDGSI